MPKRNYLRGGGAAAFLLMLAACSSDLNTSFLRPSEPIELVLFDLLTAPIDRQSGLTFVSARGTGIPRAIRLDQTDEWDVAFALVDDDAVWLPRGFFESLDPTSGILAMDGGFDAIERVPRDRSLYEMEDPVTVTVGRVYAVRSRTDPTLSLPCHIFGKLVVDDIEGTPARVTIRVLWNPNCDDTNVTPENR